MFNVAIIAAQMYGVYSDGSDHARTDERTRDPPCHKSICNISVVRQPT